MKKLFYTLVILTFMAMYSLAAVADTVIVVKIDGDEAYSVTVPDTAVVVVEKTPVVETTIIPINP